MPGSPGELVVVYLKGLAMGTAEAIPGVSGGTIALITGIYERLIAAITALHPRVLGHLRSVHTSEGRTSLLEDLFEMDVPFLLALGTGMVTAVVIVARIAHYALETAQAATFAFFFGLIGASAVVLFREVDPETPGQYAAGLVGFTIAFVLSGVSGQDLLPNTLPVVFGAATIAISAMVLPGISGSAILILIGQYEYLSDTLTQFVDRLLGALTGGGIEGAIEPGTTVVTFLAGALIGLFTVAHAINRALDAYRVATLTLLVSLLVGTLRLPIIEVREDVAAWTATTAGAVVLAAVVGAAAVVALDHFTDDLTY